MQLPYRNYGNQKHDDINEYLTGSRGIVEGDAIHARGFRVGKVPHAGHGGTGKGRDAALMLGYLMHG